MNASIHLELLESALNDHAIVSMADAAGNITYVNQHFLDISGYTRSELLGRNHRILKSGVHPDSFYQGMWDTLLSGQTWLGELCNKRKNGDIYWVRASIKPILDDTGLPIQYISIRTDITKEKLQAQTLLTQNKQFEAFFEETTDPAMILKRGRIVHCNSAALRQFRCNDKTNMVGKSVYQLSPPYQADAKCSQEQFSEINSLALRNGNYHYEWLFLRKDGSQFNADISLTAITVNGELLLHMAVRDITDRKLLEVALQQQKEKFETLYNIARDGIAVLDLESNFLAVNPAYERMTGLSKEELLKTSCIAMSAPEDVLRSMAVLQQVLATGYVDTYEKTCIDKTGQRVIVNMSLALLPDEQHILINVKNVTSQKTLEQSLYLAKELAEVTLASIGDAVITTDMKGLVIFMNLVAEGLVGCTLDEARDKPLSSVFNIIDESSRHKVESPVDLVLRDGKMVTLNSRTLLISRDGAEYNIEDSASPIFKPDGTLLGCVLVFHDVTEKHRLLHSVRWQATHDALTNLPNRILLSDRFNSAIARAKRQNALLAVCMIDLDEFKPVNDHYGHDVGDSLLMEVASRLNAIIRGDDTAARLGGDEFVLLLNDIADMDELELVMTRVLTNKVRL
ncbi:bifunctional diguanylate cyclase/phosphodiesterase [Sulfuriferula nivalis]|uniref:Diguanylate cyclase n=1 Tax=Sulfuriferula nivalis TaxID=2675298 RepID=A0A809RFN6_9PROT|nr:PAS domain S-box protein [Sulfuriferula nivalis]BBP00405.1 diguanylate cyclase [Sulfuriferula nivalis]